MHLTKTEILLLIACALLAALALFGPPIAQPAHPHGFADGRSLWGVPHALDVLSNLPFALAGVFGIASLRQVPAAALTPAERACARLFFAGLLVTAIGSGWYHLRPDDVGLAIDRSAMAVAFAGLLGLLACSVSARAGTALAAVVLAFGPLAVLTCLRTGNVMPWAVVQFGGIALILFVLAVTAATREELPVRWSLVLLAYALAKLLEANDHGIYEATGQLLSGHTLKHVAAAFAAWPVIAVIVGRAERQNGRQTAAHAA